MIHTFRSYVTQERAKRNTFLHGGFTLIEVIVSMGIFFTLASISYMQNPNGFIKIKLNTYVNELAVYIKELAVYGSSAGDTVSGARIGGAGIHIDLTPVGATKSVFAFYDIATTNTITWVTASDHVYTASEDQLAGTRISYDDKVSIVSICVTHGYDCNYRSADIVFVRPSTKAALTLTSLLYVKSHPEIIGVTISFKDIPDLKCLEVNSVGIVTLRDGVCYADLINPAGL